jgi:hypothetical protein
MTDDPCIDHIFIEAAKFGRYVYMHAAGDADRSVLLAAEAASVVLLALTASLSDQQQLPEDDREHFPRLVDEALALVKERALLGFDQKERLNA